jgi:hypothetical protein
MTRRDEPARGRLVVVTGAPDDVRTGVAGGLARRFERGVVVDGAVLDAMVVSGRTSAAGPARLDELRLWMLRCSAAIATAETYQLEGFDVVVTDDLLGDRLEDFLDLAAPEPVHVVVLDDGNDRTTPRWGLWVRCSPDATEPVDVTVDEVVTRLDEALVPTATD